MPAQLATVPTLLQARTSKGQVQKRMPRGFVGREVGPLGVRQEQVPKASVHGRTVQSSRTTWELEVLGGNRPVKTLWISRPLYQHLHVGVTWLEAPTPGTIDLFGSRTWTPWGHDDLLAL